MSENDLKGTGQFRIELPRKLWQKVKTVAPWMDMYPKEVVEEALRDWLDRHAEVEINGEKITVKEVK